MIRTYQIIDCKYTDEFDMETFALIRDIKANVMLPVVINDYYFSHYPEHEYDVYEKIRPGDFIKGDLCIIYESIKDSTGTLFFDLYHSNIKKMRPGFEGELYLETIGSPWRDEAHD